ncbi:MAG: hypothetical protein JXA99_12150 [Candidatus Lokiarchaeota archaeon]|nr:hypothetical protein [Candidatus Lokiarchaeota archaeon]
MKKKEKMGEKAWKYCEKVRMLSGLFEFIVIINFFLWIWFPLPIVQGWIINKNMWIGVIIFVIVMIPLMLIMIKRVSDAGSDTLSPSKETQMYGGIYKYIRYPQTLGEFSMFIAFGFIVNS